MGKRTVTVAEFQHPHEAHLLRTALRAAGLDVFVTDEYAARIGESAEWVKVQVPEDCVERAKEIMAAAGVTGDSSAEADTECPPFCHHCGNESRAGATECAVCGKDL